MIRRGIYLGLGALLMTAMAHADPPTDDTASTRAASPSLLQQLSDETRRTYGKARQGMVRVKLPTPQWLDQINNQKEFLNKWSNRLDPAVRAQIIEQQERAMIEMRMRQGAIASSQPATQQSAVTQPATMSFTAVASTQPSGGLRVINIRSGDAGNLILIASGLLVDNDGYAVFPVFVDRKDIGDNLLPAVNGDGQLTTATFVGSDRKTNLTVLKLAKHSGQPALLGHSRPDDGVLTLVIAADSSARLVVWSNIHPDPGLAVLPDGSFAGFGFDGHFLGASTAKPIVDQLIAHGEVHRAVLGVITVEVAKEDLLRQARPELGDKAAIRILAVDPNSAAARGGVKPDDLILAIGGEIVGDAPTFAAVIATRSGDTVLRVLRGTDIIELTVKLQPN